MYNNILSNTWFPKLGNIFKKTKKFSKGKYTSETITKTREKRLAHKPLQLSILPGDLILINKQEDIIFARGRRPGCGRIVLFKLPKPSFIAANPVNSYDQYVL